MQKSVLLLLLFGLQTLSVYAEEPTASSPKTYQGLDATLWMQTSVEHDVACVQAYRLATMQSIKALRDPCWTAAVEQTAGYAQLPPAVILDLDETVLNNAAFMARLVKRDKDWDEDLWSQWVREKKSKAIPGVKEFLNRLIQNNVAIFFITNRDYRLETPTVENLSRVLGMKINQSQVLCQNEKPDWTWNKTSRRAFVTRDHRILLLLGDDFNDFTYQGKLPPPERITQGERFKSYWGRRWILLPNPVYGDWEKAFYHYDGALPAAKKLHLKFEALESNNN
ncbi:5'-nucleotidase, lipoprotein e(P4) family [Gimesia aquarii]|uniref:Lipoprotein E n=1 Tax=Gimesia aquarii TaxID=2527964 RepID=A0A517VYI8_9PLAN|nr:HAD family acid phosphatase [Gimesia aquarii]QDT98063.1 Lipoprotein E precursor [Gimesia aquarii]